MGDGIRVREELQTSGYKDSELPHQMGCKMPGASEWLISRAWVSAQSAQGVSVGLESRLLPGQSLKHHPCFPSCFSATLSL